MAGKAQIHEKAYEPFLNMLIFIVKEEVSWNQRMYNSQQIVCAEWLYYYANKWSIRISFCQNTIIQKIRGFSRNKECLCVIVVEDLVVSNPKKTMSD